MKSKKPEIKIFSRPIILVAIAKVHVLRTGTDMGLLGFQIQKDKKNPGTRNEVTLP
jgi:hypothetical protein